MDLRSEKWRGEERLTESQEAIRRLFDSGENLSFEIASSIGFWNSSRAPLMSLETLDAKVFRSFAKTNVTVEEEEAFGISKNRRDRLMKLNT